MFNSRKILRKKHIKKNDFLMFDFTMKNMKENQILNLVKRLYIFKLFRSFL